MMRAAARSTNQNAVPAPDARFGAKCEFALVL
jgi:hypothetical protein